MSWLKTADQIAKQEREERARRFGPDRFRLKKATRKQVILVDDEAAAVYEHNFKANGNFFNWFSCSGEAGSMCCARLGRGGKGSKGSRYTCYYYTLVDCSEWTDNSGKLHKFELKLLPAKFYTQEVIATKKKDEGGLAYRYIKIRRFATKKEPAVGSEYIPGAEVQDHEALFEACSYKGKKLSFLWDEAEGDPEKMQLLKNLFQVEFGADGKTLIRKVVPFNYLEVLKPPSDDVLKGMLAHLEIDTSSGYGSGGGDGGGGESGGGDSEADMDDVPF
jgi:hypothetical protein